MLAARDKAKEDAVKLQLALTREMDANKAEAVTQAAELSRMEKELAGTSLCVVFHLDPRRPYSLGLAQVAKQSLVKSGCRECRDDRSVRCDLGHSQRRWRRTTAPSARLSRRRSG